MNEHIIEVLEEFFPDGCIVIYRNMKKDKEQSDCFGVYVQNPKQSESLDDLAGSVISALENNAIPDEDEDDDYDEEDEC